MRRLSKLELNTNKHKHRGLKRPSGILYYNTILYSILQYNTLHLLIISAYST
jgi:hypothetical protein